MKKLIYILFILVSAGLFCTYYSADVSAVQDMSPKSGNIFRLPYKDTGFSYSVQIPFKGKEIAFKKEPDFGEKDIVRGSLPAGREENDHICFAWDSTDRTLYLDLNRNLDLTDDPSGVFIHDKSKYSYPQLFTDIPIEFLRDSVRHHYRVDVNLYGSSRHPNGYVNVRSGWQSIAYRYAPFKKIAHGWNHYSNQRLAANLRGCAENIATIFILIEQPKPQLLHAV